jgi:hypothetical protein
MQKSSCEREHNKRNAFHWFCHVRAYRLFLQVMEPHPVASGIFVEERCMCFAESLDQLCRQVLGVLLGKCRDRTERGDPAIALITFRRCIAPIERWDATNFEKESEEWQRRQPSARADFCFTFATFVKHSHRTAHPIAPRSIRVMMPPTSVFVKHFLGGMARHPLVQTGAFFEPDRSMLECTHAIQSACRTAMRALFDTYVTSAGHAAPLKEAAAPATQSMRIPSSPAPVSVVEATPTRDAIPSLTARGTDVDDDIEPIPTRDAIPSLTARGTDVDDDIEPIPTRDAIPSLTARGTDVVDDIEPSDSVSNVGPSRQFAPLAALTWAPRAATAPQNRPVEAEIPTAEVPRSVACSSQDEIPLSIATS